MTIQLTRTGDQATIECEGAFNFDAHRRFRWVLQDLRAMPARTLSVDFRKVRACDSAGLGLLLQLKHEFPSQPIALYAPVGSVQATLRLTRFERLFDICEL